MNSVNHFNWVDIAILVMIALSALISFCRGFVKEALSLVSWILSFWVAFNFYKILSDLLLTRYIQSPSLRLGVAFGVLLIGSLIICAIINYFVHQLVYKTGLSGTDRLLGLLFGVARGVLLVAIILLTAHLTVMTEEKWWEQSLLIPYFEPVESWLNSLLPKSFSEHFQLSKQ